MRQPLQIKSWQQILADGFNCPQQLLEYLQIPACSVPLSLAAHQQFKTRVPRSFVDKMQMGNLQDPLLQQVLPLAAEEIVHPAYSNDPLNEREYNPCKGLLHKYHNRVLLILSSSCAINCRYCFRRQFSYQDNKLGPEGWQEIFNYLSLHPEIDEIILSGGEPLLNNDDTLASLICDIKKHPHIKTLRIHSRIPIVLPERITPQLIKLLTTCDLHCVLVTHCNHPQELDHYISQKMKLLRNAGVHLLNQTVLLKGINDNSNILRQLSYALFDCGIMPYYLHVLDKVQGTTHFQLDIIRAKEIYRELKDTVAGYLLPRLVQEIAGEKSKMLVPI